MRNKVLIIIISLILCNAFLNTLSLDSFANSSGWSEEIRLTHNTNNSVYPVIGVWENFIHVFWCEQIPGPGSEYDIFYRRSSDGGKTWGDTRKLIDTDKVLGDLSVAINQSTIHLVWWDKRSGSDALYYIKSNDSGENWEIDRDIISPSSGGKYPDIAINGNDVHVVYIQNFKLFYLNSTDNGITWSDPQQLTASNRDSNHPVIALNGSNVHIVWMDHYDKFGNPTMGAIFYINSTDGGKTWSEDINLTPMNVDSDYPDIVVNGSMIHISYVSDRNGFWEIYYERSEDNGIIWTDDLNLSSLETDFGADSKIALHDNGLHLVWWAEKGIERESYYVHSPNNGYNWSNISLISPDSINSLSPNIGLYKNSIHLVWRNDIGGIPEIYYKYYPYYPPPTNLTIDIWATNLTLNWTAPKDSPSALDHYLIYRENDLNDFDFLDVWINTAVDKAPGEPSPIPLRTTWNDTTALLDEANNYYYVVRAVYEDGEIDTNENIVGKYVIQLNREWNLISLPLAQNDTKLPEVLKSIDGMYNVIWYYNAKDGIWRSSLTGLMDINRTMGLWIHMKNKCNLSVVGAVPESTDIALYEGWNLVGYPSLTTRNLNDALSGISWEAVRLYDAFDVNDLWKHNSTKKPDNLNDLKEMKPGCGYWVYVTINDTWVRTRVDDDNKVVVWKVYGLEEKEDHQELYESITENPIEIEKEDGIKVDMASTKSINKNEEHGIDFSFIPLVILFVLIIVEVRLLYKRRNND